MDLHLFEATSGPRGNWGKFGVGRLTSEWSWSSAISPLHERLLNRLGWDRNHLWVLDLQTGEGAFFRPGGNAVSDLDKHRIWVCPLFSPFLSWLYRQDCSDLGALPRLVHLPDAPAAIYGYRRPGRGFPLPGHRMRQHGPGDWRCSCGHPLSGGPLGSGRRGARDIMRFHRLDLWMAGPGTAAADQPSATPSRDTS